MSNHKAGRLSHQALNQDLSPTRHTPFPLISTREKEVPTPFESKLVKIEK